MKQDLKNLDILTEKGQKTLLEENLVVEKLRDKWKVQVINTNKDDCAAIDNILVRDNTTVAICEIKCRQLTREQLASYGNTWLITHQKIKEGAQVSRLLRVPFIGVLYLVPDDLVLYWKITDNDGNYQFDYDVRNTETQRTVNGGLIIRENAYLHTKYAKQL
jgi:hypothetical protein